MLLISLFIIFLSMLIISWVRKLCRQPPGPPRVPLLGSIPFISMKRGIMDWVLDSSVTRYKLATVSIGPNEFFVINDFELAKELFGKEEFSGRPAFEFNRAHRNFDMKTYGIIINEGSNWRKQRRFGLKKLKDFGVGKRVLEEAINIEVEEFIKKILSTNGDDFLLGTDFNIPIINILWQLVGGTRFSEEDEIIKAVTKMFMVLMKMVMIPMRMMKMFPKLTGYEENVPYFEIQKKYVMDLIENHEMTMDSDNTRDFIDAYLKEMKVDKDLTKKDLAVSLLDFLVAGTETSSTTLKWIILYLTLYQEVQDRCREEVLSVLGSDPCTVGHIIRMPLVQATISEVQRLAQVIPVSLTHHTLLPTQVGQYRFPAGSAFLANLSYIMHDEKHFPHPQVFNPDRFIGEDGRYVKNERMIPFGIGKRFCMGELLARNEVFLFTVNLLQRLKFLPPAHHPKPKTAQYHAGLTNIPKDFHLRILSVTCEKLGTWEPSSHTS